MNFFFLITLLISTLLISFSSYFLSYAQEVASDTFNNSQPEIIYLNLTRITLEDSATGLTSVAGAIQNNSTENVDNLKVNVILYDDTNSTLRETTRFVSGPFTVYEPNSTESFSFLISIEEFDHFGASAFAERISG